MNHYIGFYSINYIHSNTPLDGLSDHDRLVDKTHWLRKCIIYKSILSVGCF
jgi:hypothetical protein